MVIQGMDSLHLACAEELATVYLCLVRGAAPYIQSLCVSSGINSCYLLGEVKTRSPPAVLARSRAKSAAR